MFKQRLAMTETAESVATVLFALEEPWRSRFLDLVADRAMAGTRGGRIPTFDEVTQWLSDRGLCQRVTQLLNTWHGTQL